MSYFSRKITSAQLAKICEVSQGTVDRALNNRSDISPATKEKIIAAAKKYGYIPNIEKSSSGSKSMLFGIVIFNLYNEYFSRLVMEIESISKIHGYSTVIMFSDKDKASEIDCINRLIFMGVDGIILCPVTNDSGAYLNSLNIPVVTVGNKIDEVSYSGIDDFKAMSDVTEYVISKNHEKIIYYAPPLKYMENENIYAQKERFSGFLAAIKEHNHFVTTDIDEVTDHSAVICSTDYHALQVIHKRGGKISGIIGFDDINILSLCDIMLDTVSYSTAKIAENAVNSLLSPCFKCDFVQHTIVIRGSF